MVTQNQITEDIKDVQANSPVNKIVSAITTQPKKKVVSDDALKIAATVYEPPVVNLQDITNSSISAQLEELEQMPTDTSVGLKPMPKSEAKPTKRVATALTMSTDGPKDYRQFEYDVNDSRGIPVVGAPEGGDVLMQTDSGTASLGDVLGGTGGLKPMSGIEGNPYYLRDTTPQIFKDIEPFDVYLPKYDYTVKSKTTNANKLAFLIATDVQGEPVDSYVGFDRVYELGPEDFMSGFVKGMRRQGMDIVSIPFDAATNTATLLSSITRVGRDSLSKTLGLGSADPEWTEQQLTLINENVDQLRDYVAKYKDKFADYLDAEPTKEQGTWSMFGHGLPTAIGQIGLASLAGKSGVGINSFLFASSQGASTWDSMRGLGLSATERNMRTLGGTLASWGIEAAGLHTLMNGRLAAGRRFINNMTKRWGKVGVQTVLGIGGEALTEGVDTYVQDLVSMNIKDDNYNERITNYMVSAMLGAASGLAALPVNVREEKKQIIREKELAGKLKVSTDELEKRVNQFASAMEKTGFLTREKAIDLIFLASEPEAQAALQASTKETIDAVFDRLDPEKLKYLVEQDGKVAKEHMDYLNNLISTVMTAMPKDMETRNKVMVSRLMVGVASSLALYGDTELKLPQFKYRAGPSQYDKDANILYISRNLTNDTQADQYVAEKSLQKIEPEQRSLLHEIGHMLDVQMGNDKNTNFREFLPAYFEAIANVFGKKRAKLVEQAMPKDGKRVGNVTKEADYLADKNTTEWFAYSLGRLGKKVGKALGLEGDVALMTDVANVMAQQLLIPEIQEALTNYNKALESMIKKNDDTLIAMAKAAGKRGLADKIERYVGGDTTALSKEDVTALFEILHEYVGMSGMEVLGNAFKNVSTETFMEKVRREFKESIRPAPKKEKKKVDGVELEDFGGDQGYVPEDQDVFLQERPAEDVDSDVVFDEEGPEYTGETIEVNGIERTVYNSNGERIVKSEPALRNFWNWFGDSKVVDEDGRPLVVYHGTDAEFDAFDIEKSNNGVYGKGFYFAYDERIPKGHGDIVMPVYLKIENPFMASGRTTVKEIRDNLKSEKYDGFLSSDEVYVKKNTQIKSTQNRGAFSPDTGNILFELPAMQAMEETKPLPMLEDGSAEYKRVKSGLERRMRKTRGPENNRGVYSYKEDVKFFEDDLDSKETKPASKWFTKAFGGYSNGDLNTAMWILSPKGRDRYDILSGLASGEAGAINAMDEFWTEVGITTEFDKSKFLADINQPSINARRVADGMDGFTDQVLTPNEAMQVYIDYNTPHNRPNIMATFGNDENAIEEVINQLTPEQKEFASTMQQFLRKKYLRRDYYTEGQLNDVIETMDDDKFEITFGIDKEHFNPMEFLDKQEEETLYWPRVSLQYAIIGDRRPNYQISRNNDPDDPSAILPATEAFSGYVYRQEMGKTGVYAQIRRMKDLFFYDPNDEKGNMDSKAEALSKEVMKTSNRLRRKALKRFANDEKQLENFGKLLKDFLDGKRTTELGTNIFHKIARDYVSGRVSWKLIQFFKNLPNITLPWGVVEDKARYWRDSVWAAANFGEAKKELMENVPLLLARFKKTGQNEMLQKNAEGSDNLLMAWAGNEKLSQGQRNLVSNLVALSNTMKKYGLSPLTAGDEAAIVVGHYGLYKQMVDKYGKAEGVRKFTQFIATRQATSNQATKSLLVRQWNRDFRGWFISFISEPVARIRSAATAVESARRGETTAKDAFKEISGLVLSAVLFSMISAGIIDLWDEDEENDKEVYESLAREGISTLLGIHPVASSTVGQMLSSKLFGGRGGMSAPLESGLDQLFDDISDGEWDKVLATVAGMSGVIIGADNLYSSASGGVRAVTDDDYVWTGLRRAMGASKSHAEKRTGQEDVEKQENEE